MIDPNRAKFNEKMAEVEEARAKFNRRCNVDKVKLGQVFKISGHKMQVKDIRDVHFNQRRVKLSCASHCCTTPYNVEMEMAEETLLRDFNDA